MVRMIRPSVMKIRVVTTELKSSAARFSAAKFTTAPGTKRGINTAVADSRINMTRESMKIRRELPENRVIIPTNGRILSPLEEPFWSSEDFLLIAHQLNHKNKGHNFTQTSFVSDLPPGQCQIVHSLFWRLHYPTVAVFPRRVKARESLRKYH